MQAGLCSLRVNLTPVLTQTLTRHLCCPCSRRQEEIKELEHQLAKLGV